MAKVILFGGGDGGGLIIGPNGIEPIPPWDPTLSRGLRAIAALAHAGSGRSRSATMFRRAAEELSAEVIPAIVGDAAGGDLEGGDSVLVAGFDGDFYCGSTGKPPRPIPRSKLLDKAAQVGLR